MNQKFFWFAQIFFHHKMNKIEIIVEKKNQIIQRMLK